MDINATNWKFFLKTIADSISLTLDSNMIDQMAIYASELIAWNKKINLTAITDPAEVAEKHMLDALIPSKFIPTNAAVIDVGTGGGFPGIPLKILMPSLSVSLVDSSRKKINFRIFIHCKVNI